MKTLFVAVNAKYVHTNIAVRYLTRVCRNAELECDFCEFTINEPQNGILEKLYMQDADVYGFPAIYGIFAPFWSCAAT